MKSIRKLGENFGGKNRSLNLPNQEPGSSSTFTLSRHFNKHISSFGSWGIPGFNFSCALKEKSKYLFLVQKIFLLKWYWQNSFRNKTNIKTKKQKKLGFPLVFPPRSDTQPKLSLESTILKQKYSFALEILIYFF